VALVLLLGAERATRRILFLAADGVEFLLLTLLLLSSLPSSAPISSLRLVAAERGKGFYGLRPWRGGFIGGAARAVSSRRARTPRRTVVM